MARIFLSFFNGIQCEDDENVMPAFYEAFCNGLKQNGNDVFVVMHLYWGKNLGKAPALLLKEIKNFNPDLIILFNNAFYDLSKDFDCPIVVYGVDSPLYYSNKECLKKNPQRYTIFELQEASAETLRQDFNIPAENIHILPFFTEIRAENKEFKRNICFIGTKFGNNVQNCINRFMIGKPNDALKNEYITLIQKVRENPFIDEDKLLEDVHSIKLIKCFDKKDIIMSLSTYQRLQTLDAVSDLGLEIWGTSNWASDNFGLPYLNLCYNSEQVYSILHNQEIYNTSRIGISISHLQAKEGFPWRILDIMASNACLVSDYHKSFEKYFPKLKLPCYGNQFEAREVCSKLLKDEAWRRDIVLQSQEIVNKNYRFENTLKKIEDCLGFNLHSKQEGSLKISDINRWLMPNINENESCRKVDIKLLSLHNKYRFKVWKHLDKKLRKKGII